MQVRVSIIMWTRLATVNKNVDMHFKEATDRLTALCPTLDDVAEAVDRDPSSIRKARLAPGSPGHRSPPPGWAEGIARLARERAAALLELADDLEGE